MSKSLFLSAAAAALVLPALAHAEDVVVTVTREPLPVSRVGQAVDVITETDIRNYQSLDLTDLLARTTSLSLVSNGGPGASGSTSIRGAGADHTLYMIDGIALNDPSQVGGGVDAGLLSVGDAARIEVLRGPLSTLWGSGALGGVVSITTRQARAPLEGDLSLEGLDQYGSARLGLGGKSGGLNWRLFASAYNDRGVSAYDQGTERDGFTQTQLSGKASYAFDAHTTLNVLAAHTHNRTDTDGFVPPSYAFGDDGEYSKSDTTLGALGLTNTFAHGSQNLSVNLTETSRDLYDDTGASTFTGRGRLLAADYHLLYRLSDTTRFLAGAKWERDDMRTASTYSPLSAHDMTVSSLYGQVAQAIGAADLTVSARHDDASSFGGLDIAQASLSLPLSGGWRLHASAGQGIKIPSLYQLYGDYGTATLKPEKGLNIDGGADFTYSAGQVSLSLFTRTVRDLIDFDNSTFTYANIARAKAQGVELEWRQQVGDALALSGNASSLSTRNESAGYVGNHLARRPDFLANFNVEYAASQKIHLGGGIRLSGESFDNAANSTRLKGYAIADIRVRYAVNEHIELYGRLDNITDTRYETADGYGQPGRRLWLGVHTRMF
ncbi:TonB-dependent receptor plug domain-containing protein [Asticcacaulis solisilvae]|uniref:TonB-dependent receptor plug domain-containing protein n=1 Tax=Asticcacaulis solisilvae TaxID=1217274 RepID=UPI003FD8F92C